MVDSLITGTSSDTDLDIRSIIKLVKHTSMLLTETADQTFLLQYVKDYCEALAENYRIYHKRTLQGNLSGNYPEYAREQLQAMEDGTANLMRFRMQEGKKYYKIIQEEYRDASDYYGTKAGYTDQSVHSFVGKEKSILGNVYKPASWKAPHTKHVRFSFCEPEDLRKLLDPNFVDWAGGYLYLR